MPQGILYTPNETVFNLGRPPRNRIPMRAKQYFGFIFLFCILMYLVLYFYVLQTEIIIDEQYAHDIDEELLNQKRGLEESMITQECSKMTDYCYIVVDKKVEMEQGQMVERHMFLKGFEDESDTIVRLIPQGEKTFESSDTRMWKVDHLSIRAQYIAALISAPFIVSTLSLVDSDNDGKTILEIGLGGGSLDMFLHQMNPKMNITAVEIDPVVVSIARKWFNVVDDDTRRTITADGLKFIQDAQKNGDKYDAVFLDACDNSQTMPCPSEVFRNVEVYRSISAIVKETGSLIVNILSHIDEPQEVMKFVKELSQHFGSCIRVSITDEMNVIAICTKQAITDNTGNVDFLKRRAIAVTMRLGLQDVLKTIKMN
ncbi:unnamed protein product [Caenorhabditis sp. 36 PRJEB53466]|nr:unnamed protein product [Caenorhabditis sp. 36 PRJEB53466]